MHGKHENNQKKLLVRPCRTRENSNLMLPAGNDGPAGSKPFRRELWILPGEDGGSPTEKPTIIHATRKAGLRIQDNPRSVRNEKSSVKAHKREETLLTSPEGVLPCSSGKAHKREVTLLTSPEGVLPCSSGKAHKREVAPRP